jgi:hypothetical protein
MRPQKPAQPSQQESRNEPRDILAGVPFRSSPALRLRHLVVPIMTRPEKMSDAQIMHARSTAWEKWDGEGDQRLWYARVIEAARDAQWEAALADSGKPATPYAWAVTGMGRLFFGAFAAFDAKDEAKRCGGDTRAFPLYTSPANESPVAHAPGVCIDINGSSMIGTKGKVTP